MSERPIVWVTGAAGFIGSHLCQALMGKGWSVVGLDNFDPFYDERIKRANLKAIEASASEGGFEFLQVDITDRAGLEGVFRSRRPEAIMHLAALAGVHPSMSQALRFHQVNVMGSENLLSLAASHGVKRLAIASSSSVYGPEAPRPFLEGHPNPQPVSPYGATKLIIERNASPYCLIHQSAIAILRFFTVYGPRQRPDLAIHKFARLIDEGRPIEIYGDGSALRDFTYIDDIVAGAISALDWTENRSDGGYEIFNLGGSNPVTVNRMIDALEGSLGKKAQRRYGPTQPGDMPHTHADIRKAETVLGYRPATDFERGVDSFVEWFRTNA